MLASFSEVFCHQSMLQVDDDDDDMSVSNLIILSHKRLEIATILVAYMLP